MDGMALVKKVTRDSAATCSGSYSGKTRPVLVAIVGGSGSGKTWLAKRLKRALAPNAALLSQDDFYLDRSHLSPAQRARLNFDDPKAIDWSRLESVLQSVLAGRRAFVPSYDFKTHCRRALEKSLAPKSIVLVEGLWLLHRQAVRSLFSMSLFLDCPSDKRLQRRIARDLHSRARTRASVERQFRQSVEPMHVRYVTPQATLADIVFRRDCGGPEVTQLARRIKKLLLP